MLAIEMAAGVYCPLSPQDPSHRLHSLLQQTQSPLVLVHHLTKNKFPDDILLVDIELVLANKGIVNEDIDVLSALVTKPDAVAYIIFTSGSTGTPKAVSHRTNTLLKSLIYFSHSKAQVRHRNFTQCMQSLVDVDTFNESDAMIQMSRCSFDIHVQEILGSLIHGATLVMLRPGGTMEFDYLLTVIDGKQISYMHSVPSLLYQFFTYLQDNGHHQTIKCLRSLCSSGETLVYV